MSVAQEKRATNFVPVVDYQMDRDRLVRSIRLLQVMILVLLVLVGVLLYWLSRINAHVDAAVRSVDAIHQGIDETFKAGFPHLQTALKQAKELNAALKEGGSLSQRLEEASDRAIEKAKRELPAAVDAIIKQKVAEIEQRVRKINP